VRVTSDRSKGVAITGIQGTSKGGKPGRPEKKGREYRPQSSRPLSLVSKKRADKRKHCKKRVTNGVGTEQLERCNARLEREARGFHYGGLKR